MNRRRHARRWHLPESPGSARVTVIRPVPLSSPSGPLYIGRIFSFSVVSVNQFTTFISIDPYIPTYREHPWCMAMYLHRNIYLQLYRSLYYNKDQGKENACVPDCYCPLFLLLSWLVYVPRSSTCYRSEFWSWASITSHPSSPCVPPGWCAESRGLPGCTAHPGTGLGF